MLLPKLLAFIILARLQVASLQSGCGRVAVSLTSDRIVGGVDAAIRDSPWLVSIQRLERLWCTGTLVSANFVLTAAHCVDGTVRPRELQLRLGSRDAFSGGIVRQVADVILHRDWDGNFERGNDIALVRMSSAVAFDKDLRPICVPARSSDFEGHEAFAAGWGAVYEGGRGSRFLRKVGLTIWPNERCPWSAARRLPFASLLYSKSRQYCAGSERGGRDTCQGDSGGPLMVKQAGHWYLAGITSYGAGCGRGYEPGFYVRVSFYYSWIYNRIY